MINNGYKLSFYSILLLIFVMLFSIFINGPYTIKFSGNLINILYLFVFHNIINSLVPAILAIVYAFISFSILKNASSQQLIMVINAVILLFLSLTVGIIIFYYTTWFNQHILSTFTKSMTIIGLLNIMLSFTFKLFKENWSVGGTREWRVNNPLPLLLK